MRNSRIEEILGKLVKKFDTKDETLNEMKEDILGISQKIEPYVVAIKQLEKLFS